MKQEKNVPCTLSDGTILRSDVYRPDDGERYPVLMLRLPYDKETPRYYDEYLEVPRMVQAGYVVILQDVRGRFASEGEFYPFIYEGRDGYEAVEWAAKLPYSNGKVGLFGMSYHGYTQLAAAVENPPSLKAIAPVMTGADLMGNFLGKEGMPQATANLETWVLGSMLEDELKRKGNFDEEKFNYYLENMAEWLSYAPSNEWRPIKDLDPDSYYFDFIKGKLSPELTESTNLTKKLKNIDIPALFIGGWFDALLTSTLETYQTYKGPRMLWVGPWTHEEMTGRCGDKFFNNGAENIGVDNIKDPTEIHIMWFDHWLKDKPMPMKKPVYLYLMGKACWEAFDEWPMKQGVKPREVFLQSNGLSQTRHGDGKLSLQPLPTETRSSLKLDPNNPVPTRGGGVLIAGHESGTFDVSDIQDRDDVLVYTSTELDKDLSLLGSIKANIWVSAPTNLFDISLRLSDVDESGRAYNIVDTFHRESVENVNQPFYLEIEIGSTSYTLKKGHRLRLDIAASNAPLYDINLNNGTTTKTHKEGKAAVEYIYQGGEKASKLILPLVNE
ncbi:CocE/NonD family hydrolase [Oceanobacillus sp. Castelsardo]|uniref:CocE/NonD family hydrolase n=1 Tax=Oceanobacillus sp. Castelsardo TaxID=1851204 RepID=UPI00083955E0|nr:CocE/NonD family hydrolase [Oceanobacillus sp. Castelsardo]